MNRKERTTKMLKQFLCFSSFFILFNSCSNLEESEKEKIRRANAFAEVISRKHDEMLFPVETPIYQRRKNYPWEETLVGNQTRITKEFFHCKGKAKNAPIKIQDNFEHIFDCGGNEQHSLPLRNGKEFIFPALIELVNFLQKKTQKQVIITCGHRCPTHNSFSDQTSQNQNSKHLIGAEIDFYIKGMEWDPETVVKLLMQYYKEHPKYKNEVVFTQFNRYEKETNTNAHPWYNKEIFIKLFKSHEGRDLDNNHRFPYISIQLRWDRERNEPVLYTWAQAFNGYLRY